MITVTILRGEPYSLYRLPDGSEERCKHGVYTVARKLIKRSYSRDELMQAVWHDSTPSLVPCSLDYLAQFALTESPNQPLKRVKYQPLPAGTFKVAEAAG